MSRKKTRRKKTRTVVESAPASPTPQVFQTPPANPDYHLLDTSAALLNEYGLGRRSSDLDGHIPHVPIKEPGFRRRPLTTMLTMTDPDGQPFHKRVYIDEDELTRTTVEDLTCFITTVAHHAGTGDQLSEPVVMLDPCSTTSGSLRYTVGQTVRDHSFHLDPDFGDALVEANILEGVAPEGFDAFTFYAAPAMKPVTIWLPSDSDDRLIEALKAENAEAPVPEPAE